MINWAKRLLRPKDSPSLLEDGFDEEGNPVEVDEPEEDERIVCDVCGRIIDDDGGYPTCPVCGVALCGSEACAGRHIIEHHPKSKCSFCGGTLPDGVVFNVDGRIYCCEQCQDDDVALRG